MKKLTSRQFWLSEEVNHVGDLYGTLRTVKIGDSKHAVIYYKSGISEIDKTLSNYIERGYEELHFEYEHDPACF